MRAPRLAVGIVAALCLGSAATSVVQWAGVPVHAAASADRRAAALRSSAGPAPVVAYGVDAHVTQDPFDAGTAERELRAASVLGARVVRVDVSWASLQPSPSSWSTAYVARLDAVVRDAANSGLSVLAVVGATPCWASTAPPAVLQSCRGRSWLRGVDAYPPREPAGYAAAAAWVAHRYRSHLAGVELWNEPDGTTAPDLVGPDRAASYARLVAAAGPAVHRAAPGVPVVIGALAWADTGFLRAVERVVPPTSYDAVSVHVYPHVLDEAAARALAETAVRSVVAVTTKPVWVTETGAARCDTATSTGCLGSAAAAVQRGALVGCGLGGARVVVAYELTDEPGTRDDVEASFGLVAADGRATASGRAFTAVATFARRAQST